MIAPRPYQIEAIDAIHGELETHDSTLIVMATGTGKTVVLGEVVRKYVASGRRALVLAPTIALTDQVAARLPVQPVGVERGRQRGGARFGAVVGGVDSMVRRLDRYHPGWFDLIVIDEAHLSAANKYQKILEYFTGAKVLGVTATPDRLDGKPLGDTFASCAYRYEIDQAIREGYLCPIRSRQIHVEDMRLDTVRTTRTGDFSERQLSKVLQQESPLQGVVVPLLEEAGDRPTVVITVDVEHGKAIANLINRYRPGAAVSVSGKDRDGLSRFMDGESQFVTSCQLLVAGWDCPKVACVAFARPIKSRVFYAQAAGRGTRLHPSKKDLLLLNFVDPHTSHRLIGPEDVLAGQLVPDDVKRAAAQLREKFLDLGELDILEMAREFVAQQRRDKAAAARVAAVVEFFAVEIDPILGTRLASSGQGSLDLGDAMSEGQRRQLKRLGCDKPPAELTAHKAEELISTLEERRRAGLCSLKQAKKLAQKKVPNPHEVTAQQAGAIMGYLSRVGWHRPVPRSLYT